MTDVKLTDEFCGQVKSFFDRALQARVDIFKLSRSRVSVDISFRTSDHPHIVQKMTHEEPLDYFPEALVLADRLDRLMGVCSAIGIMSAEQAEVANKKLDMIGNRIDLFRERYPEESALDILFLPESRADYRDEVEAIPLALARQFLLGLADDPQCIIEKVIVSWRKPDDAALKKALLSAAPKPF